MPVAELLDQMVSIDPAVKAMVLATPDFSLGEQLHGELVRMARRVLCVHDGAPNPPGYLNPLLLHRNVEGFDLIMWQGFARALYNGDSHDMWGNRVDSTQTLLNSNLLIAYCALLQREFNPFSAPYQTIDPTLARTQYKQLLRDGVAMHELWYGSGQWKNPEWEMFHHFAKLVALGASFDEVDGFINELKGLGLSVPPILDHRALANAPNYYVWWWHGYHGFLETRPTILRNELQQYWRDKTG
jgi:hypothetical protein